MGDLWPRRSAGRRWLAPLVGGAKRCVSNADFPGRSIAALGRKIAGLAMLTVAAAGLTALGKPAGRPEKYRGSRPAWSRDKTGKQLAGNRAGSSKAWKLWMPRLPGMTPGKRDDRLDRASCLRAVVPTSRAHHPGNLLGHAGWVFPRQLRQ